MAIKKPKPPQRVKLIFNPIAGEAADSPSQLQHIIQLLQNRNYVPEVFIIEEGSHLDGVISSAVDRDISLFLVCGGDSTIESVAARLIHTPAQLGIIPTGTQNNIALSLGIPDEIDAAMEVFCSGRLFKIDVGLAKGSVTEQIFLETCSIGLLSALYPAADQIQHGNLTRIGDLLAALVSSPASKIHLVMDGEQELTTEGHVVLAANMPFVGPHFRLAADQSYLDGLLDLIIFADLSKIELISNVVQMADGKQTDPRVHRYQVRQVEIDTDPKMPILADGFQIGEGNVTISIQPKALAVITGSS